jgi:hypothetical protein
MSSKTKCKSNAFVLAPDKMNCVWHIYTDYSNEDEYQLNDLNNLVKKFKHCAVFMTATWV